MEALLATWGKFKKIKNKKKGWEERNVCAEVEPGVEEAIKRRRGTWKWKEGGGSYLPRDGEGNSGLRNHLRRCWRAGREKQSRLKRGSVERGLFTREWDWERSFFYLFFSSVALPPPPRPAQAKEGKRETSEIVGVGFSLAHMEVV